MVLWAALFMLLMTACGNGNDTIWTGFSGVVILIVIIWLIVHYGRKASK